MVFIGLFWLAVCEEQTWEGEGRSGEPLEEAAEVVPAGDGAGAGRALEKLVDSGEI